MKSAGFLNRISHPFVTLVERHYPDAFVFLIVLTLLAFGMTLALTDASVAESVWAWGGGLSRLLAFTTQICLTLIAAHSLAHTDAVQTLLKRAARLPRNEVQAYAWVVLISGLCNLIAWSLGLVAGALMAQQVAMLGRERGWRLHYPLLVASAYAGNVIWHMGYSGSAPLFVATEGHVLQDVVGIIPIQQTMLAPWNIAAAVVTLAVIVVVCPLMRPAAENATVIDADRPAAKESEADDAVEVAGLGQRLNNARVLNVLLGVALTGYLALWFQKSGLALNLNIVNWSFLALGLLLARSPRHYVTLVTRAGRTVGPILLQFPFYAAIMGMMSETGLVTVISGGFTAIASEHTLGFWGFISGGLINFFIPSGGGQWAVQGPIFLAAAKDLGVDPALIVMSVAYGDQWTNMIQPFWTIPLLAIAGLHIRDIMGYTFVIFLASFFTLGGTILLVPYL